MNKIIPLLFLLMSANAAMAQDSVYGRQVIKELSSVTYWGRGYTKNGMGAAAAYLAGEYKKLGLRAAGGNYFQELEFPANSFPEKISLKINGKALKPGTDFLVAAESGSINAKGKLEREDSVTFMNRRDKMVVLLTDKLTWAASQQVAPYAEVQVLRQAISGEPATFEAAFKNHFIEKFSAKNVFGFVKGTQYPDSFVLVTAHYDHLGGMGPDVYFPGANDNASGVAMMLSLAKYFAKHPQPYSVGFIAFAGEEIGLVGSKFYTENPLVPLAKTKFVLNMDLEGNGAKGVTVVNATEFPRAFGLLNTLNDSAKYLSAIHSRGRAANSDHYFFSEKGVTAFFIYTLGGSPAYHDVHDVEANLKLEEFIDLQKLLIGFVERFK